MTNYNKFGLTGISNRAIFIVSLFCLISCVFIRKTDIIYKEGIVLRNMNYNGQPSFTDVLKIWFKDSAAIEEIHRINIVNDASNKISINYTIMFYRYIDLRNKMFFDYKHFSDTAKIFNTDKLPDSIMKNFQGWNFCSEKVPKIKGIPEILADTIIGAIAYKRAKFHFFYDDPEKSYMIGYFRCDDKVVNMFSLEKSYSRKIKCTMTKFSEFRVGKSEPYATVEIKFSSITLTERESNVFDKWEKNENKYPVIK